MGQLVDLLGGTVLQFQEDGHGELAALAQLAFYVDGAVHHVHGVLGDGHAEAGALNFGGALVVRAGERLEQDLLELRRHADAVVFHGELVAAYAGGVGRLLGDGKDDAAAVRGVLDGVAEDVGDDLLDAQTVAVDVLMFQLVQVDIEAVAVGGDVALVDADEVVHQFGQIERFLVEHDLAALNAGHIQHFVDQAEQMVAGLGDLPQTIGHPLRVVDVGPGNGCHADDGVHGGADVVAHVGKKLGLGAIGAVGRVVSILEGLAGGDLRLLFLRDILCDEEGLFHHAVLPRDGQNGHGLELGLIFGAVLEAVDVVRGAELLAQVSGGEALFQRPFAADGLELREEVGHKVVVAAAGRTAGGGEHVVERVFIRGKVAQEVPIHELDRALQQHVHGLVLLGQRGDLGGLFFGVGDVADEDDGIAGVSGGLAGHDHVPHPAFLTVQPEAALKAQLRAVLPEALGDVAAVKDHGHGVPVFGRNEAVAVGADQRIPRGLLEGAQEGGSLLEGVETIGLEIDVIFAEVGFRVGAVEGLALFDEKFRLFLLVHIDENAHEAADGAVQAAAGLGAVPEPLIVAVGQTHPVLDIVGAGTGPVREGAIQRGQHRAPVVRVDEGRPSVQRVGKIQNVVVA